MSHSFLLQDSFGDTPLHDAVSKGDMNLVCLLHNEGNVDYTLANNQGFNVIHTCALKGHPGWVPKYTFICVFWMPLLNPRNSFSLFSSIMEMLLQKARHLVDVKKDDGFAAIHLSSLNGYKAVTKILIIKGHSDINLKNGRDQTPLHLASSQVLIRALTDFLKTNLSN